MKTKSTSQSAFFNLRVLIAALLGLASVAVALLGTGAFSRVLAQGKGGNNNSSANNQASSGTQLPDVVRLVGPLRLDQDLRTLPHTRPKQLETERPLMRYPHGTKQTGMPSGYGTSGLAYVQALV